MAVAASPVDSANPTTVATTVETTMETAIEIINPIAVATTIAAAIATEATVPVAPAEEPRPATQTSDPPIEPGERALVIVAHPDDADFTAAGTMARWAKAGIPVTLLVITDGSKGSEDPDMSRERLIRLRVEEQRAAAACLGVTDVRFLGYEDGLLEDTIPLRRDLTRAIRQIRPSRMICMDPTTRYQGQGYINHPDHVAGANAALAAVFPLARNRPSFREFLAEGLEPHTVVHVFLAGTDKPDLWIDISETIEQKIAALRQHVSQIDGGQIEPMIRQWASRDAAEHGYAYAESFKYFRLG